MHKRTWQRVERKTADELNGKRTGLGKAGADVTTARLCVECKARAQPPAVTRALMQAETSAEDGQIAIARFHTVGQRSGDDIAVLRWSALLALLADEK